MVCRVRFLPAILLPTLVLATPSLAILDVTTGEQASASNHVPIPAGTGSVDVLWDLTHGVYLDYEPAGRFSQMAATITGSGCTLTTTVSGVHNIDLSPYEILVICLGSSWNSAYTAAEVTAIQDFAAGGGRVLILGDNAESNPQNVNPVAQAFGTTTGVSSLTPFDLYVGNFAVHSILDAITQIHMRAAGELTTIPISVPVAWAPGDEIVVSVVNPAAGYGCVVITGDINVFDNTYLGSADNAAFLDNVLDWLKNCSPPISVEPGTWGRVKSAYRE